jgi:hypothetical protein
MSVIASHKFAKLFKINLYPKLLIGNFQKQLKDYLKRKEGCCDEYNFLHCCGIIKSSFTAGNSGLKIFVDLNITAFRESKKR